MQCKKLANNRVQKQICGIFYCILEDMLEKYKIWKLRNSWQGEAKKLTL